MITDGEDNEGGAEDMAKQAYSKGIKVFILGIGSKEGAPIPMPDGSELKTLNGELVKIVLMKRCASRLLQQVMEYMFMSIIIVQQMQS